MGKVWKLQEARDHFSELVRRAETDGPQAITVHGREKAVVISSAEYHRMCGQHQNGEPVRGSALALLRAFQEGPLVGVELDLKRDNELPPPPIEFPG